MAVVCILLVGSDGWRTWQAKAVQIQEDKTETTNLARSLSQHAHDTIQAAGTVLVGLRQTVELDGLGPDRLTRLRSYMAINVATLPTIHSLFVFDASGHWIVNSMNTVSRSLNNSDRDYFQYHQDHVDRGVHIGLPVRSKSDGTWIITVSRRIDAPDGAFAGVVMASISVDALERFYKTFNVGMQGSIGLFLPEGVLVARQPAEPGMIGHDLSRSPLFREVTSHFEQSGSLQYVSPFDGVSRVGRYTRVDEFPLLIIVAHGEYELLADWRSDAIYHTSLTLGVAAIVALLGGRLAQQLREKHAAEARYRVLATFSSDAIVCVRLEGRRLYVSPAFEEMTGWTEEDGRGKEWACFVHPEDWAAVKDIGRQMLEGVGQAMISYRYLCKDGAHLWVEARFVLVPISQNTPAQFVANIRDISARKFAEEKLAAASAELARHATTDALTGLANRRRFDEAIDQEWRRALREDKPISLLMLDVDQFKLFNDRFGHPRGDVCLRTVAEAIARAVRRPGDLVTRYGGEEFAIILSDTDTAGALQVANRVRAEVEALGIEHPGNKPAGSVTVSLGLATSFPAHDAGRQAEKALIVSSDMAIYAAKRAGRNRVAVAGEVMPPDQAAVEPEASRKTVLVARTG